MPASAETAERRNGRVSFLLWPAPPDGTASSNPLSSSGESISAVHPQLLLRKAHSEAAEESYRKALSIAREQEARLWELRAAVSLARLHRDQHGHGEARDLLAPVYDWFTEGFETPDLREAKALLDELA